MTLLATRFPALALVPHLPLSRTTPVEPMKRLSSETGGDLWVKRDDLTADLYGGNKVRKLEFVLGDARRQGCDALVTAGAWGSHHVLATSLFGRKWGFEVSAVVVPQPLSPHVEENLRLDLSVGAELHQVSTWPAVITKMSTVSAGLRARGHTPYRVAYGGSSSAGTLGYVEAAFELAEQIATGHCPEPEAVYVALGSGGTAAGLAIGLAASGLTTKVRAVRVTPRLVCNRATIATLVANTMRTLRKTAPSFPAVTRAALGAIELEHDFYGSGYGGADARAAQASVLANQEGLTLDATYTARAMAALLRDAPRTQRPLMFVNTLSSVDQTERLAEAPPLPDWAT